MLSCIMYVLTSMEMTFREIRNLGTDKSRGILVVSKCDDLQVYVPRVSCELASCYCGGGHAVMFPNTPFGGCAQYHFSNIPTVTSTTSSPNPTTTDPEDENEDTSRSIEERTKFDERERRVVQCLECMEWIKMGQGKGFHALIAHEGSKFLLTIT
jgi:hypothetical protein